MGDGESQIIELLEQKAKCINSIDDKWITEWALLIKKYFKQEARNHIRLKAIALLSQIFSKYHVICDDELMNKLILPHFSDADQENDSVVRKPIVHLLFDITSNSLSYKNCNAILAIIRRILTKPFKQSKNSDNFYVIGNADIIDSRLIISNLIKLFRTKLHRLPIEPAVNMLDISVSYLNLIYRYPLQDPVPAEIPMIRRELFSFFLSLRCNQNGHLGVLPPNQGINDITYSPFIICVKRPRTQPTDTGPSSPKIEQTCPALQPINYQQHIFITNALHPNCPIESRCVNLNLVFAGIIDCINQESDLDVLKLVLDGLPGLLANKPLVLTAGDEMINLLCLALSNLVLPQNRTPNSSASNQTQALAVGSVQQRQSIKLDIAKSALRCLTSLLVYKKLLDQKSVKAMLAAFEDSLKSLSRHPIVPLFTTCLIELQDSSEMSKFVPVVLHRLCKFSPTVNLGTSMLEFLSYLILFPKLYENFSQDEYKFIFAIALPYTNPFRFSDYITCLAFRVIAMWYLNCRPSLRCAFVELVKKSLQSNVIQPFKENQPSSQQVLSGPSASGGTGISTPLSSTPGGLFSQASSPITQTPPIIYSCPATMSPVDQRKRSSSLNTENSFRHYHCNQIHQQNQAQCYIQSNGIFGTPTAQSSLQVNEELIETFADLLSRYTHGQYLAIAPKNRCTEMLIDRSTCQTWLIGNSLITITAGRANNGWAEIMVRRPTGNTSWIGRLQNTIDSYLNQRIYMSSLSFGSDIISLFSTLTLTSDDGGESGLDSLATLSSISSLHEVMSSSSSSEQSSGVGSVSNPNQASKDNCTTTSKHFRSRDPIPLPKDKKFDIALSNFDLITPYETHKVGVIYVGENQVDNRAAILSNKYGSPRYYEFLTRIGNCIILNDIDPEVYFIGGLDVKGADGKYAYFWKDNVTQVIFHVATFMLSRDNDPQCHGKNRHIGNDHVCIVYNDSEAQFRLSTIKGTGQFILACIVIVPLDAETNLVEVEVLPELRNIVGDIEPRVLSNVGAPLFARQMSIHLNLASKIYERRHCEGFFSKEPYVSNWVERLRCIKRIRQRLDDGRKAAASGSTGGSISSRNSNTLK